MKTNQNQKPMPDVIRNFNLCRNNLLLAIIMTAVNIGLCLAGTDTYFLFSIFFPYYNFVPSSLVDCALSVIVLATYVVLYVLSKKKPVCMIPLLVLFSIDLLFMTCIYAWVGVILSIDFLIDLAFHVWVLVYLIKGVAARKKYEYALEHANDPEPVAETAENADATDEF